MRSIQVLLFLCAIVVTAGAQVTLPDGTTVPRERMIVFLFAGHSNMAGRATPDDQSPHPRCWAYGASGHRYWEPCKDRIFNDSRGAGPATAFLKDLADAYPQYYFGVIQNANSQAGVRWHNLNENNRYWKGAGRYEELLGYARDLQGKVTFGGVVTMLGIMEATNGSTRFRESFADDFTTFIGNVRSDLGLSAANLPVLAQDYEMESCGGYDASGSGAQDIIAQIALIPGKLSHSVIIPTDNIPTPDQCHHFDLSGMRTWAQRAFDAYTANGWDFWANVETTPPSTPSNLRSGTVAMTSVEVLWDASSDASGIKEYTLSWSGGSVIVPGSTTSATATDLASCTEHSFTVTATDNAGNSSSSSTALAVTTECCTDNTPPSTPSGLQATTTTNATVALAWTQSTDDQEVAGYDIFEGSALVGNTAGASATNFTVQGLAASTQYSFTVKAKDICGNRSAASSALVVTTLDRPVVAVPFKVNLGGSATNGFVADQQWQGEATYGYDGASQSISSSDAVAGTDLDAVYQSLRYTECDGLPSSTLTFGYHIAVPNGDYVVTFMFAEFWRSSAGGREFNVTIEGQPLPENPVDIFAAVGQAAAYNLQRTVVVTDGVIDIQTGMVTSDPVISGIMVEEAGELIAYQITAPTGGETYEVGDTLSITYTANTSLVQDANFEMSPDEGETWTTIMFDGSISASDPNWGTYSLVIPETIRGVSTAGKDWMIRVRDYDVLYVVYMDGTIHVSSNVVGVRGGPAIDQLRVSGMGQRGLSLAIPKGDRAAVSLTRLNGSTVRTMTIDGPARATLSTESLANGMYLLRVQGHTATLVRRLVVGR